MASHFGKLFWLTLICLGLTTSGQADEVTIQVDGKPVTVHRSGPSSPPVHPGSSPQASEPGKEKKSDPEDKGEQKEEDEKQKKDDKEGSDETDVKRPSTPPRAPDPRELEVEPVDGRVPFNFHGQPWPDVLQWLANVSDLSLDWQELPNDYLNLTTQRTYTLPEARDLINRHLQARGYVMLLDGEVLSVFKLDKIDPSLVPTVTEMDLYDRQPHDLVKVAFELPESLEVAKAVEDFKQALSANAKLLPLAATKRVLAIDAVANLRLVSQLLNAERLEDEGREIPRRFVLKYARAEKVINSLYVVMGLDPASQPSQMELRVQMQKMQLMQQMQKKGKDVARMLNKDGPKVYLVFNRLENSILANAPPEQMKIIERTIKMFDISAPGAEEGEAIEGSSKRFAKTYELDNISPESLMNTLEEIGDLNPLSELRADRQADMLFVRGSQRDHDKVQAIIDQMDTGGLKFAVFQLRYHPADGVAGTVIELLGQEEDEDDSNNRRYYWYGMQNDDEDDESTLRVTADVDNNRLLIRGSEEEIDEVRQMLVQIGELGADPDQGPTMRVVDSLDPEASRQLLKQLRAAWPSIGGGAELIIDSPEDSETQEEAPAASETKSALVRPRTARFRLVKETQPAEDAAETDGEVKKPPVAISLTPDGRLVLMSEDAATIARLEDLINTLAPREELFEEFEVVHADAYYIHWKLEDYFEEELAGDDGGQMLDWWGRVRDLGPKDKGHKLSKRRKLRLILNLHTNSIVAANATAQQLQTIDRLISTWDKPPRNSDVTNRRTGMVKVKYSSATKIAQSLKEVYRDLLSSRDKEFETEEGKGGGYTAAKTTEIEFAGIDASGGPTSRTSPIEVRFDGALSIGVDEVGGMLLISANSEIYDGVVRMINLLDEEARPNNTIQVVKVNVASIEKVREALSNTIGKEWVGDKPVSSSAQQPQRPERRRGRGDRDRWGRRR